MASIKIRQFEPQVVSAPSLVWFEATELDGFDVREEPRRVHDRSFNRVTYVWTIDQSGTGPMAYSAPNIPDVWNQPNRAHGKKVAFVFTAEDTTYQVNLWAIDGSGNVGEAKAYVQTAKTSSVYPKGRTICLDPSGAFENMPSDALAVTSLSAMQAAINRANGVSRVLIARGQTVPDAVIDGRKGKVDFVGSFGDPSKPRPVLHSVNYAANMFEFSKTRVPQVTLDGLDCRGDWDASTETGRQSNNPLDFGSPSVRHFTIWNCRFSGIGTVKAFVSDTRDWVGGFGDTEITNWSGYGVYVPPAENGRLAFVGCDIAQHPEALNHYPGSRNGLMNTQGPVRIPDLDNVYIGASSFLSRGGWSGASDQECLRLNSAGIAGASYVVERCTLEGGGNNIKMSGSNSRRVEHPGNYLLDKVLLLAGGGKTGHFGQPHFGGTTIRNTVMVQLDVPSADDFAYPQSLPMKPHNEEPANLSEPVAIYNCSVMNLRTGRNDHGDKVRIAASTTFRDYTEENNIKHAPSLGHYAEDDHAPIRTDVALAGFTPRYRGVRPNFRFESGALEKTVRPGASFAVNYPEGTDQSYWLSLSPEDKHHGLKVDRQILFAESGGITVSFDQRRVVITNTSDVVWESGWKWVLRLDRKSRIPPMDTTFGNPTDREIPLPVPAAGSPALISGTAKGRHAYDDFLGRVRPGPSETGKDHNGDARPEQGGTQGAIHV